ncbi:tetraspanin-14 isoform X2 [Diceros bicornis minor]|uniref:tetraspanin-14 isoform X2 n=1 Tax=Diceros bicornis minor TaxID=77932 RepID=UPI0026EAABAC|nr:tetraspanin-14 isoform X2 [Diceros bicornis minor]
MHYYRYSSAEVSCWYKYLLFSYNIVFWLAGVVFLGVGLWAWSEKGVLSDLTRVTRLHGIDPVVLVLMVGVVMFTLGFAGCVGALRENICLLKFFCGAIVLIFFLELAVAVLAFLFQDWVRDRFREFFESNIRSYRDDIDLQNLIDSLQKADLFPFLFEKAWCLEEAFSEGEECPPWNVSWGLWEQFQPCPCSVWPPSPHVWLHLEAGTTAVPPPGGTHLPPCCLCSVRKPSFLRTERKINEKALKITMICSHC